MPLFNDISFGFMRVAAPQIRLSWSFIQLLDNRYVRQLGMDNFPWLVAERRLLKFQTLNVTSLSDQEDVNVVAIFGNCYGMELAVIHSVKSDACGTRNV